MTAAERAVWAAVGTARAQGLRVDDPIVIGDAANVLVRLDPSPVVARVPMTLSFLRGRDWFETEVLVASALAESESPVAAPTAVADPWDEGRPT